MDTNRSVNVCVSPRKPASESMEAALDSELFSEIQRGTAQNGTRQGRVPRQMYVLDRGSTHRNCDHLKSLSRTLKLELSNSASSLLKCQKGHPRNQTL